MDSLRRLQAILRKNKGGYRDVPDPRGEIPPEVLLQLLQPNIMTSEDRLRDLFRQEGMGAPSKEDYTLYPPQLMDQDLEQTPENMQINKQLGKREIIL